MKIIIAFLVLLGTIPLEARHRGAYALAKARHRHYKKQPKNTSGQSRKPHQSRKDFHPSSKRLHVLNCCK